VSVEWSDSIDWDGVKQRIHDAIPTAVGAGMEAVHSVVTPNVPVQSGHLQGSGGITVQGNVATLLYPGPYARYQEFGVFYRHGRGGPKLQHRNGGKSFFLTSGLVEGADAAVQAAARVLGAAL
jgi:hypothetical protein